MVYPRIWNTAPGASSRPLWFIPPACANPNSSHLSLPQPQPLENHKSLSTPITLLRRLCRILDSMCKWQDNMVLVFLIWRASLSRINSSCSHVAARGTVSLYVVFRGIYTPHHPHPFICWWTLGCSHILAIVNGAAVNTGAHDLLWITACLDIRQEWTAGPRGNSVFSFLKNLHVVLHVWLHHLPLPPAEDEGSLFSEIHF